MKLMKKLLMAASIAMVMLFAFTSAADEDDAPAPTPAPALLPPPKVLPIFSPVVGGTKGIFMGVPVERVSIGFEGGGRFPSSFTVLGGFRVEPGQTENGLGAHRFELGATLLGGRYLRFGGGLHLSYSMIVRATKKDSFSDALFGNIGGIGVGAHAVLGAEVPLGGVVKSVDIFARGSFDALGDAGYGWSAGPMLGIRF